MKDIAFMLFFSIIVLLCTDSSVEGKRNDEKICILNYGIVVKS